MKTATFTKQSFNVDIDSIRKEYKDFYTQNMPTNYNVHVSVSTTNGLSIYVSFFREGEQKDFEVRHSDHANNVGYGIFETTFSYKTNSLGLHPNMDVVNKVKKFYRD